MKRTVSVKMKRVMSWILAMIMILSNLPANMLAVNADQNISEGYALFIDGADGEGKIPYGTPLGLHLSDDAPNGNLEYLYATEAQMQNAEWYGVGPQAELELGSYYINYELVVDDDVYTLSQPIPIEVVKGQVGAASNLRWDGGKAVWNAASGGAVDGYEVTLYKEEIKNDTVIRNTIGTYTLGAETTEKDLSTVLLKNKEGQYSFDVKTLSGDAVHYEDAEPVSSITYSVVAVTLAGDDGVESVSGETTYLLPGNSAYNTVDLVASVKSGYELQNWSADGFSFENNTATIVSEYAGSVKAVITATTKDVQGPSVTSFTFVNDNALQVQAADTESGMAAVAISKAETKEQVADSEWISEGDDANIYTLTEGGIYYAYAKDQAGNVTAYTNEDNTPVSISVTKVTYVGVYENNTETTKTTFFTDEHTVLTSAGTRPGYTFNGWKDAVESGNPVSGTLIPAPTAGYTLYAQWTKEELQVNDIADVSKTYDGTSTEIKVTTSNTGLLSYEWYKDKDKDDVPMDVSGETLNVRNVKDSGSYRVVITMKDTEGEVLGTAEKTFTVSIEAAPLTITARSYTITYGEAAPTLEVYYGETQEDGTILHGLVGDDTADVLTLGSISCAYQVGDPVTENGYLITLTGFAAENYSITLTNGSLRVTEKSFEHVTATLAPADLILYEADENGEAIAKTPAVIVMDGETVLTAGEQGDYTVSYENNQNATTDTEKAVAVVTLHGNYSGEIRIPFDIQKASVNTEDNKTVTVTTKETVEITKGEESETVSGWTYDNKTDHVFTLNGNYSDGTVTYFYAPAGSDNYTTEMPVDAGEYQVYAAVAEGTNYQAFQTEPIGFTIAPRVIILTAASDSFPYTGNPHSNGDYTQSGEFVSGQGFSSVRVSGSQTIVGTSDNEIYYELTSATKEENYQIITVKGVLEVTPNSLTVPSGAVWSKTKPGTAEWVRVSKDKLTIKYQVQLYAFDGEEYISVGEPRTTEDASWSFADEIRAYALEAAKQEKTYSYFYTIQAIPAGGENQANYQASSESSKIGTIYTAEVSLASGDDLNAYAESLGWLDKTSGSKILLKGETVAVEAELKPGYSFVGDGFSGMKTVEFTVVDRESGDEAGESREAVLSADFTESVLGLKVNVDAFDSVPEVSRFEMENAPENGYGQVKVTLEMYDRVGLAGWMLSTSNEDPAVEDQNWNLFEEGTKENVTVNTTLDTPGTYYAYVKDTSGNINRFGIVTEDEAGNQTITDRPLTVYGVTLKAGDGTGEDQLLLKCQNTVLPLPELSKIGYEKTGYHFQNWYGTTGVYENNGTYSENKNDTLTAHWTDTHFDYIVNYYYMDTTGKYTEDPVTKKFNAIYGTIVTSETESIQQGKTGFELDTVKNKDVSITIDDENKVVNVYYARKQYTVTFTYTLPGKEEPVVETTTYYYGAPVKELERPAQDGYAFVGWLYGDAGSKPATMPANNVTATGSFVPGDAKYHVRYFLQDLDTNGAPLDTYTLAEEMNRDRDGLQGQQISVSADTVQVIEGFTYQGVVSTFGSMGSTQPAGLQASMDPAVQKTDELYINLYYTRNQYTATLNVWQGNVGEGTPAYTYSVRKYYGAPVDAEAMAVYDRDNWNVNETEYVLASYVDWSTGTAPSTMPAGDVTVTRQMILRVAGDYKVEVWVETDTEGEYIPYTFTFTGNVGTEVTVGEGGTYTVDYSTFTHLIPYLEYYDYKVVSADDVEKEIVKGSGANTLSGPTVVNGVKVTNTNEGEVPATLRVFFERKIYTTTITYYYNNSDGKGNIPMATVQKSMKWGQTPDYNYEVLSLFDSSAKWAEPAMVQNYAVSVGQNVISDPAGYDFRTNNYVASYISYYKTVYGDGAWKVGEIDSEDKLQNADGKLNTSYSGPMGFYNNYVHVYYTKADTTKHHTLQVGYNANGLYDQANAFVPLTVTTTVNGETVDALVMVADEAMFYKDSRYVVDNVSTIYPGLNYQNLEYKTANQEGSIGRFLYTVDDSNLVDGYTRIEIGGKTYYQNTVNGVTYVYIPLTDNRLFAGNFTSYSYPVLGTEYTQSKPAGHSYSLEGAEIGLDIVKNFMESYKKSHTDARSQGIYVYNHSWGSGVVTGDGYVTITFRLGNVYTIHYNLNGTTCQNHEYAPGTIDAAHFGCTDTFNVPAGYEIVWYKDSGCTDPVTLPFELTDNITVFGKLEKLEVTNRIAAYYELTEPISIDGQEYRYITLDDLEIFAEDANLAPVKDENGNVVGYTYAGQEIIRLTQRKSRTFEEISISTTDLVNFGEEGFSYDDAHASNRLISYVQTEGISLQAYFMRNLHTLTVDPNMPRKNTEIYEYRFGQTVTINDPTRDGFSFGGWKWSKKAEEDEKYSSFDNASAWNSELKQTTYTQIDADVQMKAIWIPDDLNVTIIHYFQNNNMTFDTSIVPIMMKVQGTPAQIVYMDGAAVAGKVYSSGGVSFEVTEGEKKYVWYFANAAADTTVGGLGSEDTSTIPVYQVYVEDLSAVVELISVKQNDDSSEEKHSVTDVASLIKTVDHYTFSHVQYLLEEEALSLGATDTFENEYGMSVEYYYTLTKDLEVDLRCENLSGTTVLATLIGEGEYAYGEMAAISASVPAGYTFLGWYLAEDVHDSEGNLIKDLSQVKPITTNQSFIRKITENVVLIAMVSADAVAKPNLSINGKNELEYGYRVSTENALTTLVTFPEGSSNANFVSGYQWYLVTTDNEGNEQRTVLEKGNGATFLLPEGWDAGTYTLECDVTVARRDNGLSATFTTDPFTLMIDPTKPVVAVTNYEGDYDAALHTISMTINGVKLGESDDFTVYFADRVLSEDDLDAVDVQTTLPSYQDVATKKTLDEAGKLISEERSFYTIYYYIKSNNPNYIDDVGSGTVKINPLPLTLSAGDGIYSKVYDGSEMVTGNDAPTETTPGGDLWQLRHSNDVYVINGLLEQENVDSYIIACEAEYNNRHVEYANALNIRKIQLALRADDSIVYNYYFADDYDISLSAYIDPMPLEVTWVGEEFMYDGENHIPQANLDLTKIPAIDEGRISLASSGQQSKVGDWSASTRVVITNTDGSDTLLTDFSLANASKTFSITKRPIVVSPVDDVVTYDGGKHTLEQFTVAKGQTTMESALVNGHTMSAVAVGTGENAENLSNVNAGTYAYEASGIKILDANGADVTANYAITPGDATLTIEKKKITISGIWVDSKPYDGTRDVVAANEGKSAIHTDEVKLEGMVDGDNLVVDGSKISAVFENESVGNEKKVQITIVKDALGGEDIDNYDLNVADSQKETTADITPVDLTITAQDREIVYGEDVAFGYEITGYVHDETAAVLGNDYTISYVVVKQGGDVTDAVPYKPTLGVGKYDIYPVFTRNNEESPINPQNYVLKMAKGTLTITPRPIYVKADETITKTYDGTTTATIGTNNYAIVGAVGTPSGIVNDDTVGLTFKAAYDDPNATRKEGETVVFGAEKVTLTDMVITNPNYKLQTESVDIPAVINKAPLTVTADSFTGEKAITYGEVAPTYSVTYHGFVNGETEETAGVLTGSVIYTCAYSISDANNRGVGEYAIDIQKSSTLAANNYAIAYVNGTLEVKKAVVHVYVTADRVLDNGHMGATYGVDPIPEFRYMVKDKGAESEFFYGDTFEGVTSDEMRNGITFTYPNTLTEEVNDAKKVISSEAGNYTITINLPADLAANNYEFVPVIGTLEVGKFDLVINGITVKDRIYDGTTTVRDGQYDISNVNYTGLMQFDRDYMAEHDSEKWFSVSGNYDGKDVLYDSNGVVTDHDITLTITLGSYLSARYTLVYDEGKTQTVAQAKINPRPVSVTAQNQTIPYGNQPAAFEAVYGPLYIGEGSAQSVDPNSGLVSGESANAKTDVTFTCNYVADAATSSYSDVGTYVIQVFDFRKVVNADPIPGNYVPVYNFGTLTVEANQLATPVPVWSTTDLATITWDAVSGIGAVSVDHYLVQLYKGDAAVGDPVEVNGTSHSFEAVIRGANGGAGDYKVTVQAIASTTNNVEHKNVQDSNVSDKSASLYAANVSVTFAGATAGQSKKEGEVPTVNNQASYLMIAGESGTAFSAWLENETGYTVSSITTDNSSLSVGSNWIGPVKTAAGDNPVTDDHVSGTVSMGRTLNTADDIHVIVALEARPATLQVEVTPRPGANQASATYGYSNASQTNPSPELHADATPDASDTVDSNGYRYTYVWEVRTGSSSANVEHFSEGVGADWRFPEGKSANKNSTYYTVRCLVTATRLDNGETIQMTAGNSSWNNTASYVTNVTINRAQFSVSIRGANWTYGNSRIEEAEFYDASVTDNPAMDPTSGEHKNIKYQYMLQSSWKEGSEVTWTAGLPTEAGEYYVRAIVPETTNYMEFTTEKVEWVIKQNKLAEPDGLTMNVSDTASYGTISWNTVSGIKENAGVSSASEVTVTYQVVLQKLNEDTNEWETVKEYEDVSGTSMNILDQLKANGQGQYWYTVQAMSSNTNNVLDSEVALYQIQIGAYITVNGNSVSEFTKKYDENQVTLEAVYVGANEAQISYQWYKGKDPINGATQNTLKIAHVEDSGNYSCVLTIADQSIYTNVVPVTITKRSITFTSINAEKIYDGQPLTTPVDQMWTDNTYPNGTYPILISGDGFAQGEGASFHLLDTATITNVTPNGVKNGFGYDLNDGTRASDYEIAVPVYGTLTIIPRPITVTAVGASKIFADGDPALTYTVTDGITEVTLANYIVSVNEVRAKGEDVGKYDITVSEDEGANPNYSITFEKGEFEITARPITVTAVAASKVFADGDPALTYTVTDNRTTVTLPNYVVSVNEVRAKGENVGKYDITVTEEKDANPNYEINFVNGTFEITARPITVTAVAASKVFADGDPALTYTVTDDRTELTLENNLVSVNEVRAKGEDVGKYDITVSEDEGANPNYSITFEKGEFEITARPITVTAVDASKVFADGDPALTYTVRDDRTEVVLDNSVVSSITVTREVGEDVDTYKITASQKEGANPNYKVTFEEGEFKITARPIIVTAVAASKVFADGDPALTYTVTDDRTKVTLDNNTVSVIEERVAGEDVGFYAINLSQNEGDNPNYTINFVNGTFEITARPITVSAVDTSKVFADGDPALTYTVTDDRTKVTLDNNIVSVIEERVAGENVGFYAINLSQNEGDNPNYTINFVNGTFEITTRPITVSAVDTSKVFADGDPALTYTVTDDRTKVTLDNNTVSVIEERVAGENVGFYAINLSQNEGDNPNYTINFENGTFEITARPISVAAVAASKVFADGDPALTYTVTDNRTEVTLPNYVVSVNEKRSDGEDVGKYDITFTEEKDANPNYDITFVKGEFEITARPITVTPVDASKVFADGDPTLTYMVTDDATTTVFDNSVVTDIAVDREEGENVDTYVITASQPVGTNLNYSITFAEGTFTITQRPITVTAVDNEKIYGNDDPLLTYKVTDDATTTVFDNSVVKDIAVIREEGENVDTYVITASQEEGANPNYSITFAEGTFEITQRPITVTAVDNGKIYGYEDPELTYVVSEEDLVGDDELTQILISREEGENVDTYVITVSQEEGANANYDVTFIPADFVISQREITVVADDMSKPYGDEDPEFTYTVKDDALAFDDELEEIHLEREEGETLGDYVISISQSEGANSNYFITFEEGEFTIDPRPVTVTADDKAKTYGAEDPELTFTAENVLENEPLEGILLEREEGERYGEYEIYVSQEEGMNPNYEITFIPGTLSIAQKALTITIDDQTKIYGEDDPKLTFEVEGLLEDDDLTVTIYREEGEDVGLYGILAKTESKFDDYLIVVKEGLLTIGPKKITVTADDKEKLEGEKDPELTYTVKGLLEGDSLNISLEREAGEAAGTYVIKVFDTTEMSRGANANHNYEITFVDGTFTIKAKEKPVEDEEESKPETPVRPDTGDSSHVEWWIAGLLVSVVGMATLIYKKKKDDEE